MDTLNPVISLSTSFLQRRFPKDGYAMLCRAAELGFEYVELGHSVPITSVEGILRALKEGVVKVSSVHNFCPVPPFASGACPNLFSPSTKSDMESQQWLRHTRNSVEFAKQTGARALVTHCGSLSYFLFRPDAALEKIIAENKTSKLAELPEYDAAKKAFLKKSAARAEKKDYKFLLENLAKIEPNLEEAGIVLGLENREGAAELPLDWTFKSLFEKIGDRPRIKVWHDIGHSRIKQLRGLFRQCDLIEQTYPNIVGWHIHDCTDDCSDHIALGLGGINFAEFAKYFDPQKHIFTLELNSKVRSADAADSLKRFRDILAK